MPKNRKRKPIPRKTKHFQLRMTHPIDTHVDEILDYARSQRREVTVIRDGVRLLWALENNDLSVLWDLFPHLKPQIAPVGGDGGAGGRLEKIESMLELVVSQQASNGYLMQSAAAPAGSAVSGNLKALTGAKAVSMPTFDDDDEGADTMPALAVMKATGDTATANLMRMLTAMAAEQAVPPMK